MVWSTKIPQISLSFSNSSAKINILCYLLYFFKLYFPLCRFGFRIISCLGLAAGAASSSGSSIFFIIIIDSHHHRCIPPVPLLWVYSSILGLFCHCCAQKRTHDKSFLKKDNDLQSFRSHCCCARKKTIEYMRRRRWLITKKALYRREVTIEQNAPIFPIFVEDMHLIRWYCSGGVACW